MPKTPPPDASRALNRVLLREAGEHLGTLAEQAHEQWGLGGPYRQGQGRTLWNRYAKLRARLQQIEQDYAELSQAVIAGDFQYTLQLVDLQRRRSEAKP